MLASLLAFTTGASAAYLGYSAVGVEPNSWYRAAGLFGSIGWLTDWLLKGPLRIIVITLRRVMTWTVYAFGAAALIYCAYRVIVALQNG